MNNSPLGKAPFYGLAVMLVGLGSVSLVSAAELNPKNPLNPPGAVYWCPHKTSDQQYASTFQPGCSPLVEETDKRRAAEREKEKKFATRPPIKIQDIQGEVTKFVRRYRQFLDCCANDLASMDKLEELQDDAYTLLKAIQETGLVNMSQPDCPNCRGWTLSQIIPTVAQARDDLRKLKTRLQSLDQAYEKLDASDYEAGGKLRRDIQQEEKSISKDFQPKRPPDYAPTGTEIGNTTLRSNVGPSIENTTTPTTLRNAFGADIGDVASPDSDQRKDLNPRRGADTQNTTLPTRQGTATKDSTLQDSIGFEIGTPQGPTGSSSLPSKAGPAVGNSSLNSR